MGYTLLDDACVDAQDCSSNPCQNGAKCMDKFDDYECMCPKDFTGKDCDLKREAVFLTIRAGGIIPIVACLLLLLRKFGSFESIVLQTISSSVDLGLIGSGSLTIRFNRE